MQPLTDAYLEWKHGTPATGTPAGLAPTASNSHPVSSPPLSALAVPMIATPPPSSPTHDDLGSFSRNGLQDTEIDLEESSITATERITEQVEQVVEWELDVYDLFTLEHSLKISRDPSSISPALDFMRHGYITKTAKSPDVAVSMKTLELLYRLRQRRASFSVEAFTKVICDYYQVSLTVCYNCIPLIFHCT